MLTNKQPQTLAAVERERERESIASQKHFTTDT